MKPVNIYQVYTRNFSKEGTFYAVMKDLGRIRNMGFNVIYLLPIHPIGMDGRKGGEGSPYSIRDYYAVDSSFGTMADFKNLLKKAHEMDMKVMMDIVLHHSARDHEWVSSHPEYYYHNSEGVIAASVEDWSDVYDFDFSNRELRSKLISMLVHWARLGVDGYRFDIAGLIPIDFLAEARKQVDAVKPDFLWLAEDSDLRLINYIRGKKLPVSSESELLQVFDHIYPYDVWPLMEEAIHRKNLVPLQTVLDYAYSSFPDQKGKILCLENHDQERIAGVLNGNLERIYNWTAFSFLVKGTAFLFNGQETLCKHKPSLFEKDPVSWNYNPEFEAFIRRLNLLREETCQENVINFDKNPDYMTFVLGKRYTGLFNVNGIKGKIETLLDDGEYHNMISNSAFIVVDHMVDSSVFPILIKRNSNG